MNLVQQYSTRNDCYIANQVKADSRYTTFQTRGPLGLMLHSVGCSQPSAQVFANSWAKSYSKGETGTQVAVHAALEPGKVIQCLPWNFRGWHGGGDSNNSYIGIEMTEPSTIKYASSFTEADIAKYGRLSGGSTWVETSDGVNTKAHVLGTYATAVELFAMLCNQYKLDPLKDGVIISHAEGYKRGVASNHGDPEHIWNKFGLTMSQFRKDVKAAMANDTTPTITAPTTTTRPVLRKGSTGDDVLYMQKCLCAHGFTTLADGSFGSDCEDKVKQFQAAKKLTVDGICGPATWGELEKDPPAVVIPAQTGTGNNPSAWAKTACEWAIAQGIFAGDGKGNYDWGGNVTREMLAQVLYNSRK